MAAALKSLRPEDLWRYPDPTASAFRETAAALHGVPPDQIMATNGGDQLLRLVFATYVDACGAMGLLSPGYGIYQVQADIHGVRVADVTLEAD